MIGFTEYTKANLKILLTERVRLFLFDKLLFVTSQQPDKSFTDEKVKKFISDNMTLPKDSLWYKAFLESLDEEKSTTLYEFVSFLVFNLGDIEKIKGMVGAERKKEAKDNLFAIFNEVFADSIHRAIRFNSSTQTQSSPIEISKKKGGVSKHFELSFKLLPITKQLAQNFTLRTAFEKIKPDLDNQRKQINSTVKSIIDDIK